MILKEPESILQGVTANVKWSQYKVLDMAEIPYSVDTERFGWTIELINIKRYCIHVNKLMGSICKKKSIDHSIIDIVNDSILKNVPPGQENVKRYFEFQRELSSFIEAHYSLFKKSVRAPFEAEIFVLGLIWDMENDEAPDTLWFNYDCILNDYLTRRMEFDEFYDSVKKQMNS